MTIPDEAVEAASAAIEREFPYDENNRYIARLALEAAYPILISHEIQQTTDAHRDAMVNRETSRELLAQAWDEGHSAGVDHADGLLSEPNPYRTEN